MILRPITIYKEEYPAVLAPYLSGARCYDSSSSPQARVIFIDKDNGYFLKISNIHGLERECDLTRYFYSKGLAANVVEYTSDAVHDYLLTEKIQGHDCIWAEYLEQPERLCDTLARQLFVLHSLDYSGCPVQNHTERYLSIVERNFAAGRYDLSLFSGLWEFDTPGEAYRIVEEKSHLLQSDALLHGDYCLPNLILNEWQFSGLIDLDSGGVGDRHVDLFWGAWTLFFNLKTDQYRKRFYDAYGRDKIDEEKIRLIAACEVFG